MKPNNKPVALAYNLLVGHLMTLTVSGLYGVGLQMNDELERAWDEMSSQFRRTCTCSNAMRT
jgi:hypothetical protein